MRMDAEAYRCSEEHLKTRIRCQSAQAVKRQAVARQPAKTHHIAGNPTQVTSIRAQDGNLLERLLANEFLLCPIDTLKINSNTCIATIPQLEPRCSSSEEEAMKANVGGKDQSCIG